MRQRGEWDDGDGSTRDACRARRHAPRNREHRHLAGSYLLVMDEPRHLWGLGGISVLATAVVLLGAGGAGDNIAEAARSAFGAVVPGVSDSSEQETASASDDEESTSDTTPASSDGDTATPTVSDDTSEDTSDDAGSDTPAASTPAAAKVPLNIKHVFVITLRGAGAEGTFGASSPASYLTGELRPKGTLLSKFTSLAPGAGTADRIASVSGQPPNDATRSDCTTYSQIPPLTAPDKQGIVAKNGCVFPNTVSTIGEQLQGKRLSWRGYAEDIDRGPRGAAATCRRPDPDQADPTQVPRSGDTYAARNTPWVYFRSLIDVSYCDSGVLPLSKLSEDLRSVSTTPNYAYLSPGVCSDGSLERCGDDPGGLAAADAFLRRTVPTILDSPAFKQDGLLVIAFVGGPGSTPSSSGALLISKYVTAGATSTTEIDAYGLLRTTQDIFALPKYLAKAATATSLADTVLAAARPPQPGDD